MQAERTRRAAILTAEGEKESAILRAECERQAAVLRAEGEAAAYRNVRAAQIEMTGALFERSDSDLSPESLRYLYLKALPEMAQGPASKPFVVPSKIQDLAGTIGALAGGAGMAAEDAPMEEKPRRITAPNGEANRRSHAGSDLGKGDGGDDRLVGGRGDDAVHGSDGEDVVAGNPGNDRLTGGTGSDRIEAAEGTRDAISCGNGPRDVVVFDSDLDRFPDGFSACEVRKPR